MMTLRDTPRLRDESGFTLTELLLAMSLGLIVLMSSLSVLDSFSTRAARQTRITAANDLVRNAMDRVVSDLRQSRAIEVADANDVVYTVTDAATAIRRERICRNSATGVLWRSSVTTASPPATPIASGTACPTPSSNAAQITSLLSANSASNPLFTYDSASAASVRSIGLTFILDAGNSGHTNTTSLRAGAFVRAKRESALAVDEDDIGITCTNAGVPTLTLNAGVGPLTVTYTGIDGNALGTSAAGGATTLPAGSRNVVATITAASGAISQLVKTIAC
jgi:prepilin-type N-terminal cleavage/methylation domain-containing protein